MLSRWETVNESGPAPTPLPLKELTVICCILMGETVGQTFLFPFVPFMIKSFGITKNETEIGRFAGLVASSFMFAQFLSSFFWGWMSDKWGKRNVLLFGLVGNVCSIVGFGFATSLPGALCARITCGLLNGNIGVAKSYLGCITDESNQAKGFSAISCCWALGAIVGPVLGGGLASPAHHFPEALAGTIFDHYPYLLPALACSGFSFVGLIVGFLFLREPFVPRAITLEILSDHEYNSLPCHTPRTPDQSTSQLGDFSATTSLSSLCQPCSAATSSSISPSEPISSVVTASPSSSLAQPSYHSPPDVGVSVYHSPLRTYRSTQTVDVSVYHPPLAPHHSHSAVDRPSLPIYHPPVYVDVCVNHPPLPTYHSPPDVDVSPRAVDHSPLPTYHSPPDVDVSPRAVTYHSPPDVDPSVYLAPPGDHPLYPCDHQRCPPCLPSSRSPSPTTPTKCAATHSPSIVDVLKNRNAMLSVVSFCCLRFGHMILDEAYPLWCATNTAIHGLGYTSMQIGQSLIVTGASLLLWQLMVCHQLNRIAGSLRCFRVGAVCYALLAVLFPFCSSFSVTSLLLVVILTVRPWAASTCFTSLCLMTNNSVERRNTGLVNGFAQSVGSFCSALSPLLSGNVYAWSLSNALALPFDYHFVFFLAASVFLVALVVSLCVDGSVDHRKP